MNKKNLFFGLFCCLSTASYSQTPAYSIINHPSDIVITFCISADSERKIDNLDSVYIKTDWRGECWPCKLGYLNIPDMQNCFEIRGLQPDIYHFAFFSKGLSISPVHISVCSKCADTFPVRVSLEDSLIIIFEYVSQYATYKGGTDSLATDFFESISCRERKILRKKLDYLSGHDARRKKKVSSKSSWIIIEFFVTKEKKISDLVLLKSNEYTFYGGEQLNNDLALKLTEILEKVFSNLNEWELGELNGMKDSSKFRITWNELYSSYMKSGMIDK